MRIREPYQIIIMRPTGERAVMTIRSFWIKVFLAGLVVLIVVLAAMAVRLTHLQTDLAAARQTLGIQSGELKDLGLLLARKDEEIISLKKRLSMSTVYQLLPEAGEEGKAPAALGNADEAEPALAPMAGITELRLVDGMLNFKVENVRPPGEGAASGNLFILFKKQGAELWYPSSEIRNGFPVQTKKGLAFTIRNFKPMSIPVPPAMTDWESITFQIFDEQGKPRLSMPLDRSQIQ
ncbi:MAG: hypothetical protein WAR22_06255 [Desulfomonilia bacterium]|jgi:hypothetical protein